MRETRFFDEDDLERLGLQDLINEMSASVKIGTILTRSYPYYPDLVRQFLALVELRFTDQDGEQYLAGEGTLSYLAHGVHYSIIILELCTLYGFDPTPELI